MRKPTRLRKMFHSRGNVPARRPATGRRLTHRRLSIESLEARTLLSVVYWDGGGGDFDWNNPLNWYNPFNPDTNVLPGPDDDAVIDVPGSITVTHNSGTNSVKSLTSEEGFALNGGLLRVAETVEVNKTSRSAAAARWLRRRGSPVRVTWCLPRRSPATRDASVSMVPRR